MSTVGEGGLGIMSTLCYIMSTLGETLSTPESDQHVGVTMSTPGAYHDECGRIS